VHPAIATLLGEVIALTLAVLSNTGWDLGVGPWFDLWRVAMYDSAGFDAPAGFVSFTH
jgi:hypothetical protein